MKLNKKEITALIINICIVINVIILTITGILFGASGGQPGEDVTGINYFKPYTIDSNVLLCVVSFLLSVYLIIKMNKKMVLPRWLIKCYYVATTSITLTMLTVIFFLFPTILLNQGFDSAVLLFLNDMFFFHVANPVLAIISFLLLRKEKLNWLDNLIAVIPMFIYSMVYLINVAILHNWSDFYGFTFGGNFGLTPIVLVIMFGATYLIGWIIRTIRKRLN